MLIHFCNSVKSLYLSRCFCSTTILFSNKYKDFWKEELSLNIFNMPKKSREYVSSDESESGSHSEEEKPKKKPKREEKKSKKEEKEDKPAKKASSSKVDDEEPTWSIGNKRQVTVRTFKGKLYIDIREMYLDANSGDLKPGRKGISLTPENYNKLKDILEEVDEAVARKA
ncbi:GSCOCG00008218001-RA-CDS [Cotesia congregata]|uniref:Similar to SUB1: Activated RNA polymerase II transcriptional coactivator p15 (Gallus gallus) n=1 Tax=Cotesia congregata TaxID=51543 RepID=A0A8J2H372_COTCN|nr:GSCOCG00008218001-RA-CDS [Cotesia congregata]CAG5073849.1 Similar to SUB1: Activated RNA polymerase II transcriptional coactivator p15 (Gallus gallus) [Cotesia congregata]